MASAGDLETKFKKAADFFKAYPKGGKIQLSNDQQLKFYSLFKIATVGKCNIAAPGVTDLVGKAKYDAWNGLGDKSKNDAMTEYIQALMVVLNEHDKTPAEETLLKEIAV
ncbi:Acyl-CoA-binding domain-containing protein 5A-like [Oopsacas minuta]|uniref:Acyl-CoA-binding domain-containing protein 5A-like n=1 Tax=Oopsacas minuta TaxID=111878 RepID=A0AAV7K5P1_9METZ|nr:Acyl-CoA-binding domain-containing protein 5A-like [Oopsacas minuta]